MTQPRVILLASLLLFVAAGCNRSEATTSLPPAEGPGAPPMPSAPKLDSPDAEAAGVTQVLRATGSTLALKQAELGPKASGVLAAVLVEEGQLVKKGQPLFRLDATNPALAVKQAEAALAQARVGLTRADIEYNRMKPVVDQGAVSPATWDAVRLGYDQAKVAVQQAEAALATTRAYAADTTVVAPFAGIVAAKKKNAGETVTMMPVTTIIVLQDISKIEVRVKLSENALTRVHAGEPMVVKFGALGIEKTVPIDRINPSVDPLNRTVELIGVIPNEDRALKAGMLVEVTFPSTAAKPQSTEVPAAAAPSGLPAKTTLSAHISSQPGRKP